ncbi:MAG TPA: hypothetical protein VLV78_13440 [Thermoanaerobaculia bacterium]|nr:hypothetical protein [Thermoanaerobaculia bacterium]
MPTEVEQLRDLAKAYWAGQPIPCPRHPGVELSGSFVQTTFADHIFLTCPRGKETITIPQRPRQMEFYPQAVEGMVENVQRGDAVLCYRCQSKLEIATTENPNTGRADYTFTCVRCFSYGTWSGNPALAKIGSAPTSGTKKKKSSGAVDTTSS